MINSYRDLKVWRKAFDLCIMVYGICRDFPGEERYGLTSHIKKTSVSLPSNIAEGHGRHSTKEYIHFLNIAFGSLCELETQLLIADRLGFIKNPEPIFIETTEIGKMLKRLIQSLRNKRP